MKDFLFVHGKHPKLSAFELRSVFSGIHKQHDAYSLISLEKVDQALIDGLGGTIKICERIQDPIEELLSSFDGKILYGVSTFERKLSNAELLKEIKEGLRIKGRSSRFMNKNFENISSGILNKSDLMEKGADLVCIQYQDGLEWYRTVVFQNIDNYSKRDYEKPRRDMKVGMMPPKLIQMMINFSRAESDTAIYDPFCGLGGTPVEALLKGHDVWASDLKGRLIDSTLKNLMWLAKHFDVDSSKIQESRFFQHDATDSFSKKGLPEKFCVVTEGYLGPPLEQFPTHEKQEEIFKLLNGINSSFFENIAEVMQKGMRVVMTLPYFRSKNARVHYPQEMLDHYLSFGFDLKCEREELLYERKNQVVGREVLIFERQ